MGEISAVAMRTLSALVSAERRAQRENDRREERGVWAGHSKRIVGPPDSGSSTSGSYVVSCTDARPSPPTHFLPSAASSLAHLPAGHGEKFRRTERTFSSALVSAEWRAQRENDRRNQFIRQRLSSVSVHNAAGGERTRRSVPSIHFLEIQ